MKRISSIFLFLLFCLPGLIAQQDRRGLSFDLREAHFNAFVRELEAQADVRVFFRAEWFENYRITYRAENVSVEQALERVLVRSGMDFQFPDSSRVVILPGGRVPGELSVLRDGGTAGEGPSPGGERQGTGNGEDYIKGTRAEHIPRIIVVGDGSGIRRGIARVRGRLINAESGEPVTGATMVELEGGKGSVSDGNGNVSMALQPGRHQVQFSFIGMETIVLTLDVRSDGDFNLQMQPAMIALDEVQIMGEQYRTINTTEIGVERFNMSSLKQVPVFMGERDVIKISKLLPGITSAGEASVGVNVRGGNVDQNIFYINRVPVYNTSHLFGFFSAFNSDIIREFSIYKGNVPANFGGRLSSVFNIHTRKGNKQHYTAHAGISPISAHATVEGPLKKGSSSFLLSGRSSYSDWILGRMQEENLRNSKAFFYDFSGSLNFNPNEKNEFNLFYYQSYDRFRYASLSNYEYANRGGSASWKHNYSPAFSSTLTTAISTYMFGHVEQSEISNAYSHEYMLDHNEVLLEFDWVPGLKQKFNFGVSGILYRLDRGEVAPYGEASLRRHVDLGKEQGLEGSVFASDNIQILPWLSLYAGLRYSVYSKLGPGTVMLYEEGVTKTEASIVDSVHYGSFEPINFHSGPEARAALNVRMGPNTSFKLSYTQMRQYLFMLSNTVTISPTDQWKLSDYHIDPQYSTQYTAGFYRVFPSKGVSFSVEAYYKQANNIVDFKDGIDFISTPYTETLVLQGEQEAYGLEFMLQKSSGRLDGWISYTRSYSEMLVMGDIEGEDINHGLPYPSNFDRPHVLNVVANYNISRRFSLASNVVYMSGRPSTFPTSLYFINDVAYLDYYSRNGYRLADYFRWDLGLNLEGNLKADKRFHSTWSVNVYNVLGRNNPQSIFFTPNGKFIEAYSFSVIGVPVFTLSWNVKMGNYESQ